MAEVMDFNFGGHHDLAAMAERVRAAGVFEKRQTRQGICRSDATSPPRAQKEPRPRALRRVRSPVQGFQGQSPRPIRLRLLLLRQISSPLTVIKQSPPQNCEGDCRFLINILYFIFRLFYFFFYLTDIFYMFLLFQPEFQNQIQKVFQYYFAFLRYSVSI